MYGLGIDGLGSSLSIGEVKQVNPNTYTANVYIRAGERRGTTVECQFHCRGKNDLTRTGTIDIPDYNDLVYVDWRYGPTPVITGSAHEFSTPEVGNDYRTTVSPIRTFGGEDKYHEATGKKNYRWGPADLMPGDRVIGARGGSLLSILAGGVASLKAGPLAQIVMSKWGDLVRIVSRNFEVFSDFGVMRMRSKTGVTSFEILGNQSGKKSNAHHESSWDYAFKIGGTDLFDLSLKNLFRFRVDTDGGAYFKANTAQIDLQSPPEIKIRGNARSTTDGHRSTTIGGDDWSDIKGTKTEKMGRQVYINSGARNEMVAGPHRGSYLGSHRETVRGTSLLAIDTVGKETRVAAGDYLVSVGNPLDLGVPAPLLAAQLQMGSYKTEVFSGDIDLQVKVKGDVKLQTLLGDASLKTIAGNATVHTSLGNAELSTLAGNVDVSTLAGKIDVKTLLGEVDIEATLGAINLKAPAGQIKLQAGAYTFSMGPTGISIDTPGGDLIKLIGQILTHLATDTLTPGYGSPITNAAAFALLQAQWTLGAGVPT